MRSHTPPPRKRKEREWTPKKPTCCTLVAPSPCGTRAARRRARRLRTHSRMSHSYNRNILLMARGESIGNLEAQPPAPSPVVTHEIGINTVYQDVLPNGKWPVISFTPVSTKGVNMEPNTKEQATSTYAEDEGDIPRHALMAVACPRCNTPQWHHVSPESQPVPTLQCFMHEPLGNRPPWLSDEPRISMTLEKGIGTQPCERVPPSFPRITHFRRIGTGDRYFFSA